MPIRRENKSRYPANWKSEIRPRILSRAQHRCEGSPQFPDCRALNHQPHPVTGSKVVLTIAHLSDPVEDCSDENLRAWCQRCHLNYDHERHQNNRRRNVRREIEQSGQLTITGIEMTQ